MRIYKSVNFQGAKSTILAKALIDTGASITLIPLGLAQKIGARLTGQSIIVSGVNDKIGRALPCGVANITFPSLDNKGGPFFLVVSDVENKPIIGIDILTPLGIHIDTKTQELSIKNESWEAFKTLTASGALFLGALEGLKALEKLLNKKQARKR
jgi:predicted aspartyl protease